MHYRNPDYEIYDEILYGWSALAFSDDCQQLNLEINIGKNDFAKEFFVNLTNKITSYYMLAQIQSTSGGSLIVEWTVHHVMLLNKHEINTVLNISL